MVESNQRQHPRISSPRVLVRIPSAGRFRTHYLRDLSQGGLFVRTDKPLPLERLVDIDLEMPGWGEPLSLRGRVVRIDVDEKSGKANPVGFAVRFEEMRPEVQSRLAKLIADHGQASEDPQLDKLRTQVQGLGFELGAVHEALEQERQRSARLLAELNAQRRLPPGVSAIPEVPPALAEMFDVEETASLLPPELSGTLRLEASLPERLGEARRRMEDVARDLRAAEDSARELEHARRKLEGEQELLASQNLGVQQLQKAQVAELEEKLRAQVAVSAEALRSERAALEAAWTEERRRLEGEALLARENLDSTRAQHAEERRLREAAEASAQEARVQRLQLAEQLQSLSGKAPVDGVQVAELEAQLAELGHSLEEHRVRLTQVEAERGAERAAAQSRHEAELVRLEAAGSEERQRRAALELRLIELSAQLEVAVRHAAAQLPNASAAPAPHRSLEDAERDTVQITDAPSHDDAPSPTAAALPMLEAQAPGTPAPPVDAHAAPARSRTPPPYITAALELGRRPISDFVHVQLSQNEDAPGASASEPGETARVDFPEFQKHLREGVTLKRLPKFNWHMPTDPAELQVMGWLEDSASYDGVRNLARGRLAEERLARVIFDFYRRALIDFAQAAGS